MMKRFWIFLVIVMIPLLIFGQSYNALWKKVEAAGEKDLPQTQREILQLIIVKATKEKAYGQLMKAELQDAQVMTNISPDSLKPALERLQHSAAETKDVILKTVWQTVLYHVVDENRSLEMEAERPVLTDALCDQLAQVKDTDYDPMVIKGIDSRIFNHDLLHVIGCDLREYRTLQHYYDKVGNRKAACIMASKVFYSASELDALMQTYGDLTEAGELAIARNNIWNYNEDDPVAKQIDFIHQALNKWGGWQRMNILRDKEKELTNPQFSVAYDHQRLLPNQPLEIRFTAMRHLSSMKMTVYRVNAEGDIKCNPTYRDGYKKIKPLLAGVVSEQRHQYTGKRPFDFFEDSMTLKALPVGLYMVEFKSEPTTEIIRHLVYVSDVYTIAEPQPLGEGIRYVVVSATTGQPIAGANLRIKEYYSYSSYDTTEVKTDAKGEYIYQSKHINRRREAFAYTDSDKACPPLDENDRYTYYDASELVNRTCIFSDRAIYRPGQTVHASALLFQVKKGIEQSVVPREYVHFTLRDANYKVIDEKKAVTDDYGTCAVDFTLPASGLTGRFNIEVNNERLYFRVEEYKRPTFHVDFPEVKEAYAAGDTLAVKGTAMTYAGVPVQGAKVSYKVTRRTAFWWWTYNRYWDTSTFVHSNSGEEVYSGVAETGDDGTFMVNMPLEMPETSYPMFYSFVVTADVTDSAGEMHTGTLSLPLGNRKQALSIDIPDKILSEDQPKAVFHLMNAAGQDIDAEVNYRLDHGAWLKAKTLQEIALEKKLKSGRHTLEAVCEGDTITRDFVLFSLDDQQPATETEDWFWLSHDQFPIDGSPVTLQVGSSAPDVHIVYSIFSGRTVIERGSVDKSNALLNRKFTYKDNYESGLLLTFAWVKDGKCYTHSAQIKRPMPDKRLKLEWKTFRDRLTPGQEEEWILTVKDCNGKPVDAQLMATLYDQSLDQLVKHQWGFSPYLLIPLPSSSWSFLAKRGLSMRASLEWDGHDVSDLVFSHFNEEIYPSYYRRIFRRFDRGAKLRNAVYETRAMADTSAPMMMAEEAALGSGDGLEKSEEQLMDSVEETASAEGETQAQVRENLNETAFFYPKLTTDADGNVALKFTLPESLTTWRFMGLAHTTDLYFGMTDAEAVAQKDVMIQPNIPRFLRDGDEATISARIFNTSDKLLKGTAVLTLSDPETGAVVQKLSQPVTLKAGETTPVAFKFTQRDTQSLLVCQMTVSGDGFSDGEQHYLPVLPSVERVTVTVPITQHHAGETKIDLSAMLPSDSKQQKLTVEYTNNPVWLMIQSLPVLGTPSDDNAISQAASYYSNALGKYIIDQNQKAKVVFERWKRDNSGMEPLTSALSKNQELKDLLLNETPWMMDADNESDQKQRIVDFFDDNLMKNRLESAIAKLEKLQLSDGAWTWWDGMPGSFYMTVAVSEMLVRLNDLTTANSKTVDAGKAKTNGMLTEAFGFMGREMVDLVNEMKKREKDGHKVSFPSFKALEWLYLVTLDGRELPKDVQVANDYLLKLLKKDVTTQSIYEKALSAVIFSKSDPERAATYVQSLKEYTVFTEEMGRYYDTPRAGYSWYDYKIPTQTVAIEALQRITPDDRQTIEEMQRWLLQEKRTQAWDTPINSVNAVYAFLGNNPIKLSADNASMQLDGKPLELPEATAAIGYVKTTVPAESKQLTIQKTTEGTSWGAVYAQFFQPSKSIADTGSGLSIKRELIGEGRSVGDRIRVRITITADRDYDFVQVIDRKAACLEPIHQLSGWHDGSYCTPRDCSTNYYFDCLSKGKHVIENEYYIDRAGTYQTGSCSVECAYAPEFRAVTKSQTLIIKE